MGSGAGPTYTFIVSLGSFLTHSKTLEMLGKALCEGTREFLLTSHLKEIKTCVFYIDEGHLAEE